MQVALRHPILAGLNAGLALALTAALVTSGAELRAGDTPFRIILVVAIFFVPVSIATLYVARFVCSTPEGRALLRVLWPLAAAWFSLAVGWGAISDWNNTRRYAREGEEITGEVVSSHPQDHNTLVVRYVVANLRYQRTVPAPGGTGQEASDYGPGDPVKIHYYASAPGEGFCRLPQWKPATTLEGWFIAAGIMPVWLAAITASVRGATHKGGPSPRRRW